MAATGTYVKDTARTLPQASSGDGTEEGYTAEMEATITGPLSYPTGGFLLTTIASDLTSIKGGWQMSAIGSTSRTAVVVRASGLTGAATKIKVFTIGVELAALTTLTADTWSMVFRGAGPLGS